MIHNVLAFDKLFEVDLGRFQSPAEPDFIGVLETHSFSYRFKTSPSQDFPDELVVVAWCDRVAGDSPLMDFAPGLADSIEPGVQ